MVVFLILLLALAPIEAGVKSIEGKDLAFDQNTKVLMFLNPECPCSNAHLEHLKQLANQYSEFTFYAVHSVKGSSLVGSSNYYQKLNLPFSVIDDRQLELADKYGAVKTPHVFVIKDEEVIFQGGVSDSSDPSRAKNFYLRDALVSMRANRPIEKPVARALGCYIER